MHRRIGIAGIVAAVALCGAQAQAQQEGGAAERLEQIAQDCDVNLAKLHGLHRYTFQGLDTPEIRAGIAQAELGCAQAHGAADRARERASFASGGSDSSFGSHFSAPDADPAPQPSTENAFAELAKDEAPALAEAVVDNVKDGASARDALADAVAWRTNPGVDVEVTRDQVNVEIDLDGRIPKAVIDKAVEVGADRAYELDREAMARAAGGPSYDRLELEQKIEVDNEQMGKAAVVETLLGRTSEFFKRSTDTIFDNVSRARQALTGGKSVEGAVQDLSNGSAD